MIRAAYLASRAWARGERRSFRTTPRSTVRDEWRDAVLDGLNAEEATTRLVKSFDDYLGEDEDTEKLFWMALAAAQFETGRLLPEVRDRALAIIEGGGDVERWLELTDRDEILARQRERVLERLAAKLRGPQPKPKRLRRQSSLSVPFDVGAVVRVHDEDGDNEALVLVVGHIGAKKRNPVVAALDWEGGAIPRPLFSAPILPDHYAPDRWLLIDVFTLSKKDIFGPHVGEVVAKDVTPSEPVDPEYFAHSMRWGLVASSVREAQRYARERARA